MMLGAAAETCEPPLYAGYAHREHRSDGEENCYEIVLHYNRLACHY